MKKILSLIIISALIIPHFVGAYSFDVFLGKNFSVFTGRSFDVYIPTAATTGLIDKVESGTITLNPGESTDTATLSSSFDLTRTSIHFLGSDVNITPAMASSSLASIYIDNATTIRATRGTTGGGTLIVAYQAVQWATGVTNSIQRGETFVQNGILVATTTLTTPVTTSRAVIMTLGSNSTSTAQAPLGLFRNSVANGGGTEVSSTRQVTTDGATSTWQVIDFAAGYVDSVQEVQITIGNTTSSNTATISSVTTADSVIFNGGFSYNTINGVQQSIWSVPKLTNATTVTQERTSTVQINIGISTVVDFNSAYLNSATQSVDLTVSAATSNTATISSVNTSKSLISWAGQTNNTNNQNNIDRVLTYLTVTNSTTVTGTKGSSAAGSATTRFMVLESK